MKRNIVVASIFYTIVFSILFLNSFVSNILGYWELTLFVGVMLIAFKVLFGFEKDRHRYIKDISLNNLIIILSGFGLFYVLGLFIGFVRTDMIRTMYGFTSIVLPLTLLIFLKEFLRYQMINKFQDNKWLILFSTLFFIFLDITGSIYGVFSRHQFQIFLVMASVVLPAISRNIVASYISYKVGYKPNLVWILVVMLYGYLLPIVPDVGDYLMALIKLLFPIVIGLNVYRFFDKRKMEVPLSYIKRRTWIGLTGTCLFIALIVYFTSGYFKYYSIAIATGSMTPNIYKGDVVIINQKYSLKSLDVGDVIAFKYADRIIVHRIVKIQETATDRIFYTKGDANNVMDDYAVYPSYIMGTVDYRIPYVGLPTVWLNEL